MNRALSYIIIAIAVGLTLVLAPATIFASKNVQNHYAVVEQVPAGMSPQGGARQFAGFFDLAQSSYPSVDFTILAICFVVALAAYLLLKRRAPRHITGWMPPY